jgi:hypothetical protein
MSGPLPQPGDTPETLHYRHLRSLAGLVGMGLAIGAAVAIQVTRNAHDAALLAKGCPAAMVALPTTWLQFSYSLAIPVGMPLALFVCSLMLFSPTVLGEIKSLLPWSKGTP